MKATFTVIMVFLCLHAFELKAHRRHTDGQDPYCTLLGYKNNAKISSSQGDHLSGKPGNVREFETCQGNVRDVVNSQGNVSEFQSVWRVVTVLSRTDRMLLTYTTYSSESHSSSKMVRVVFNHKSNTYIALENSSMDVS